MCSSCVAGVLLHADVQIDRGVPDPTEGQDGKDAREEVHKQ